VQLDFAVTRVKVYSESVPILVVQTALSGRVGARPWDVPSEIDRHDSLLILFVDGQGYQRNGTVLFVGSYVAALGKDISVFIGSRPWCLRCHCDVG